MKIVYVDGKYLPRDRALIPVDDLAVLRGYAAWDILRTFRGRPYFLDEHVDRLMASAAKIGLDIPWSKDEIKAVVHKVLEKNPAMEEVNIRILITGGSSPDYFSPAGSPRLIVLPTNIPKPPEEWYSKGIKVVTHQEERAIPDAKVTDYVQAALALKTARAAGAVDALYVTRDNLVLEATTSNLFAFMGEVLVTPDQGVLKGITRETVISLARCHYKVAEQPLPLSDLLEAREVFITATNKGVVPVVQINGIPIGSGRPGPGTMVLMEALRKHTTAFRDKI
ncbi:MAG: aminotransferase class IV [Desulfobacter sp.]|nr:MAG: aminotransferase class IV [Desulfobacter sp.]